MSIKPYYLSLGVQSDCKEWKQMGIPQDPNLEDVFNYVVYGFFAKGKAAPSPHELLVSMGLESFNPTTVSMLFDLDGTNAVNYSTHGEYGPHLEGVAKRYEIDFDKGIFVKVWVALGCPTFDAVTALAMTLCLTPISGKVRLKRDKRTGVWWLLGCKEGDQPMSSIRI